MVGWRVDRFKMLSKNEIEGVLADIHRRSKRSTNVALNGIVFRLAAICGLRVSEIAALRVRNISLRVSEPFIHVENGKGKKSRDVPIPDTGTVQALEKFLDWRKSVGAKPKDCFLIKSNGRPFVRQELGKRWKSAIKSLPSERRERLSIHCGRHTSASQLLERGESLASVRDFLGHADTSVTSIYLHGRDVKPQAMYGADEPADAIVDTLNDLTGDQAREMLLSLLAKAS